MSQFKMVRSVIIHPYDSGNAMSYVAEMNVEREAGGEKDEKC